MLDAWRRSPTRYREDSNVEDDYARGAYRDRLLVELAQNAVDAARASGRPARLLIAFEADRLVVANTGAPLDRAGVESLASMRASTKSGDTSVGRFGVGFASVLAVTDSPALVSREAGVRFSRRETVTLLESDPGLAAKLAQHPPPVLRLPFACDARDVGVDSVLESGFDTVVALPWRDDSSRQRAAAAVASIDDALFVSLPDLTEVVVLGGPDDAPQRWTSSMRSGVLTVTADDRVRRWRLHESCGEWRDAKVEEVRADQRLRSRWQLTWAVPITEAGTPVAWADEVARLPARVVHAPTPTDEVLSMPALLVGTFPVDPTRRRLSDGPLTDAMVTASIDAYVEVVASQVRELGVAAATLVPEADLVGPLDGRVRSGVRDRLSHTRWLPRASDRSAASPSELVLVEPAAPDLVAALAPHVSDLLDADWLVHARLLRGLGVTTSRWSEVWDVVARLDLAPETWHEVYRCAGALDRTSLEGLPVLLADGRVSRDPRQCVAAEPGQPTDDLRTLGLAVVDGVAMHPLLERVGVQTFDARQHLRQVPALVRTALDEDQSEARRLLVSATSLLAVSAGGPDVRGDLGSTPVPTQGGEWLPAAQVVLPDTPLATFADADVLLDDALAAEHRDGWLVLGVLDALTVVPVHDTPMDPDLWDALMVDGGDWCMDTADLVGGASPGDVLVASTSVVRGVELLEGGDSTAALELVTVRGVRDAIVEPARLVDPLGRAAHAPSPAAWWLSEVPLFSGRPPAALRLPGDPRLAPFFDELDPSVTQDVGLLEAIGVHTTVESWLAQADGPSELLTAMADPTVEISDAVVGGLYSALGRCGREADHVDVPDRLLAQVGGRWQLTESSETVVAVAPHHCYVSRQPSIPGDGALAELLDLGVSDDHWCGADTIAGSGTRRRVPEAVSARVGVSEYWEHDVLSVDGHEVDWWVTDGGQVHACTLDGLAQGLAWAEGRWAARWELAARLSGVLDSGRDLIDSCYDE